MTATAEVVRLEGDNDVLVRAVVARVWRRYRDYVEFADLYQEAAVWWYGKGQRYLAAYLTDENKGRMTASVARVIESYAKAQRAQVVGYEPRDQYNYQPREVLDLIPVALDPDGIPERGYASDGETPPPKGNLAEGGDLLAALVDVRRALAALPEDDIQFLTLVDDCQGDWERVAVRLADGVQADSLRRRHARIAERMARWLSKEDYE